MFFSQSKVLNSAWSLPMTLLRSLVKQSPKRATSFCITFGLCSNFIRFLDYFHAKKSAMTLDEHSYNLWRLGFQSCYFLLGCCFLSFRRWGLKCTLKWNCLMELHPLFPIQQIRLMWGLIPIVITKTFREGFGHYVLRLLTRLSQVGLVGQVSTHPPPHPPLHPRRGAQFGNLRCKSAASM